MTQQEIEKRVMPVMEAREAIALLREHGLIPKSYDGHLNAALNGAMKKATQGDEQPAKEKALDKPAP